MNSLMLLMMKFLILKYYLTQRALQLMARISVLKNGKRIQFCRSKKLTNMLNVYVFCFLKILNDWGTSEAILSTLQVPVLSTEATIYHSKRALGRPRLSIDVSAPKTSRVWYQRPCTLSSNS